MLCFVVPFLMFSALRTVCEKNVEYPILALTLTMASLTIFTGASIDTPLFLVFRSIPIGLFTLCIFKRVVANLG